MSYAVDGLKKCSRCQIVRPVTEYWRNEHAKDCYDGWCKVCRREYDRGRASAKKLYLKRAGEPKKQKARTAVRIAIRAHKMVKEPCFLCDAKIAVAHHLHYDYPLKVIWLCGQHHWKVHHGISE